VSLRVIAGFKPSLLFENPYFVWAPGTLDDALAALEAAQEALHQGYWIAGAISYEFGAQLHGVYRRAFQPLLVLGAFGHPKSTDWDNEPDQFTLTAPLPRIAYQDYACAIQHLLALIRDGEVYQVNYTLPFDVGFSGDPFALFTFLARRTQTAYSTFLQYNELSIASLSPELFLRLDEDRLTTKPMKGTAPLEQIEDLENEKNRAEHLMIVDLLRNDLHRICDDVRVESLFDVERYPTFATITSTISGRLRRATPFLDVLRAMFPCGSITGAPKRAAMRYIEDTEQHPRGFYTGTMGFLSPLQRGWWNVPIRTLQIDARAGHARYDAGGGIVYDSRASDEWNEVLLKSRFLRPAFEQFSLWESFRGGPAPSDVQAHFDRLTRSAAAFGIPLDMNELRSAVSAIASSTDARFIRVRARLNGASVSAHPLESIATPVDLCISRERVRSGDPFLRHKTVWRPQHEAAAREASERGCFDAILQNERGELTEGARTNIFVQLGNSLYTPPLECGVLPGILRSELVACGKVVERVLTEADLRDADAIFVGNSARGLLQGRIR
jgi:para-aminobenzoate synthetase/4-amino-4-deoxychorismate lyase